MLFHIEHIQKHFGGVHALDDISFSFPSGKITGLIGPNGSGKSTLINVLTGMVPYDSGTITIDNTIYSSLQRDDAWRYGLARTFQEVRVFEFMTVYENLSLMLTRRPWIHALMQYDTVSLKNRVQEALAYVGLEEKQHDYARELSYGQRKLLEIARVLLLDATILFFDEPFAGLFQTMAKRMTDSIQMLSKKGKTVILIEHNMDSIRTLSDTIVVLNGGKILASGVPAEVLAKKEVIEAYLGI